jgi:hypothetical protein
MKFRMLYIVLVILLASRPGFSQELNCNVSLNTSQIQGTNKEVFNTLRESIADFMNNTVWTNNVFEINERIECNILINITEQPSADLFKGTIQVQSRRPVFGSSYNTTMLNYIDNDLQFKYIEFDPLQFSENSFISNLPSMLAYYAYIIIGLDYDSFSPEGGDPYFEKADKIVNNAQSAVEPGWKAFENSGRKNRYLLVNNLLSADYKPLRDFNYKYHRLGLDVMDQSSDRARLVIKDEVLNLEKFYNAKPDPFIHYFQVVLESKSDEIVQIFSQAPAEEKRRVQLAMVKIDPANPAKYASLKE